MASCEKCWRESGGDPIRYIELISINTCTPEEQAGESATICAQCGRKTIHQYCRVCVNKDCSRYLKKGEG